MDVSHFTKSICSPLVMAGVMLCVSIESFANERQFWMLTDVDVRSGPGQQYPIMARLPRATPVWQAECKNNFCYISFSNNKKGWIPQAQHSTTSFAPDSDRVVFEDVSGFSLVDLVAKARLNLRDGPGRSFNALAEIPIGEAMVLLRCQDDYCLVSRSNGQRGWVLETGTTRQDRRTGAPLAGGANSGGMTANPGIVIGREAPPFLSERPQACFYEHINYGGRSFCMNPNVFYANLAESMGFWNDAISSIKITGPLTVKFCQHAYEKGECRTITEGAGQLGIFNDRISWIIVLD
ncbi:SH3 domain-containing protein [Devosia sp. 2618]|uniref:peptidase inhibitor family I36 protein n=1 Tax=Devosia sp. 2618 TaxID=3156454 RepID=UPI003395E029